MCEGISLNWRELPENLIQQHQLSPCVRTGGEREYRFMLREHNACLPAWFEGQLQIVPWSGYCEQESLSEGDWQKHHPLPVDIPASFAVDRGVWYLVREGFRGIMVSQRVYLLRQPATHYYQIMTRNKRMPVMIGESI